jgi:hypothetical protein
MKLEILIKDISEFRTRNDVAIHLANPTYNELLGAVQVAERDLFPRIVIYVSGHKEVRMSNIFASNSTWNKLRRDLGDVRYGMIERRFGQVDGQGFTIYLAS